MAPSYWHSDLSLKVTDDGSAGKVIEYSGRRRIDRRIAYQGQVRLPNPQHAAPAEPGTLEHFLVERYRLFAVDRREVLRTGIVHHAPYQLSLVQDGVISENFSSAPGLFESLSAVPDHWAFSWGVDVRVSPLSVVAANTE
ncbi:MAG: DUF2071 domain-containing protein [Pirellulaceae bacterium]|nr:DUF2071 domain-containing protein [Pirellulaceae bacterium]